MTHICTKVESSLGSALVFALIAVPCLDEFFFNKALIRTNSHF